MNTSVRKIALGILLPALALCSGCYVVKQGFHVLAHQARAREVGEVLASTDDAALRSFLLLAQRIKRYAVDSLGLAEDDNYTTYVETDKSYMVDVVAATRNDCFEQHRWCYPIVGCVPYKGYFDSDDAVRLARRLKKRGFDVYQWQAGAFSTLGFLTDPLFSHMQRYSVFGLASLIVHEQTHATLYLKGQAQFNEELATFVGTEGALRFISQTYGDSSAEYRGATDHLEDRRVFRAFTGRLYASLDSLYGLNMPREAKLREKQRIIAESKERFRHEHGDRIGTERLERLMGREINNAYLSIQHTYNRDLDLYYRVYAGNGADLRSTIEELLRARQCPDDPKGYLQRILLNEPLAVPSGRAVHEQCD